MHVLNIHIEHLDKLSFARGFRYYEATLFPLLLIIILI